MNEFWKDIQGYEGKYMISNLGKIKSINYHREGIEKILKLRKPFGGYIAICLTKNGKQKNYFIHRLVAQAFLGLELDNNSMCVCHKNDIRDDNRVENLFLGTYKENTQDMLNKGRGADQKGIKNPNAKLTEHSVLEIINKSKLRNIPQTKIATEYGISYRTMRKILAGTSWKHITI